MKSLKNMAVAIMLAVVLTVGTANAGGGLLMGDFAGTNNQTSCTETSRGGIIMSELTGILIAGFTGILMGDLNETPTTCGN